MRKKCFRIISLTILIAFLISFSAWASPAPINYYGKLTDPNGIYLNGDYLINFSFYTVKAGGTAIWTEEQTVTITDGLYNLQLGTVEPFPSDLLDFNELYFEISIYNPITDFYETLSPRQSLTTTVYFAMKAGDAEAVDGKYANDFLDTSGITQIKDGELNVLGGLAIGTDSLNPNFKLQVHGSTFLEAPLYFGGVDTYIKRDGGLRIGNNSADLITLDAGKVGIGTTSPESKLHVVGDLVLGLDGNNKKFILHSRTNGNGDFLQITHDNYWGNWNWEQGITLRRGGNVGIGTTNPKYRLHVDKGNALIGWNWIGAELERHAILYLGDHNHYIKSEAGNGVSIGTNWAPDVLNIVEIDGYVGIGTTTPESELHVVGDLVLGLDAKNKKFIFHSRTYDNGDFLQITHDNDVGARNLELGITLRRGGNVGIGTTSPGAKLHIGGSIGGGYRSWMDNGIIVGKKGDSDGGYFGVKDEGNNRQDTVIAWGDDEADSLRFIFTKTGGLEDGKEAMRITSSGTVIVDSKVGIGTTSPESKLHAVGDLVLGLDANNKKFIFHSRTNGNGDFLQITHDNDSGKWNWEQGITLRRGGNVGIGVINPSCKLQVDGKIEAEEIEVKIIGADFVFNDDYDLKSLDEVENYIKANKHLPEIPCAKEWEKGIKVGEMQSKLLQKIEELTLYMIEQNKTLIKQNKAIRELKIENEKLKKKINM